MDNTPTEQTDKRYIEPYNDCITVFCMADKCNIKGIKHRRNGKDLVDFSEEIDCKECSKNYNLNLVGKQA